MGCECSRVLVWWSKPGRKRLSSGDSDFRQDSEEKADTDDEIIRPSERKESRLRKMFSRKKSKEKSQNPRLPGKSGNDFSRPQGSSIESDAESAVRNRNAEQVIRLMQAGGAGFDFLSGSCLPHKFNPVELACSLGYFDIVEVFLDNGCSPNLPTSAGKLLHTVLESIISHKECLESGRKLVKHMISLGCDLDIKDRGGVTPLMHCAQIGDHELMRMVLDRCSDRQLTCVCSGSMYTPLHMSVMKGDYECVKLLLSRSPHKHVNIKDKVHNTALHLALKSMLHNIPYLNAAKENLVFGTTDQSKEKAATCQHLMSFQQNAVAIVEALVMAGAEVHAYCRDSNNVNLAKEESYPLVYALHLCDRDETLGFELDPDHFSSTLNLVSRKTIQSLEDLGRTKPGTSQLQAKQTEVHGTFSPYAGVVRLLVLAGTEISMMMRSILYRRFDSPSIHCLLDEVCAFWDKYQISRPPKLVFLAKLAIRVHLANVHHLHQINRLPLPPRMKDYLKLNYL